jgi:uncharacterized DUF497 family protein
VFDWGEKKYAENLRDHKIRFDRAYEFDMGKIRILPTYPGTDPVRYLILGALDGKLYSAVVTPRGGLLWLISLRRANRREEKLYATSSV